MCVSLNRHRACQTNRTMASASQKVDQSAIFTSIHSDNTMTKPHSKMSIRTGKGMSTAKTYFLLTNLQQPWFIYILLHIIIILYLRIALPPSARRT